MPGPGLDTFPYLLNPRITALWVKQGSGRSNDVLKGTELSFQLFEQHQSPSCTAVRIICPALCVLCPMTPGVTLSPAGSVPHPVPLAPLSPGP